MLVQLSDRGCVTVAAYQAPLLAAGSMDALDLIRARVQACEVEGVAILCCPEANLGGLAEQSEDPDRFAISVRTGQLDAVLAPLASDTTTTIVGFTEPGEDGYPITGASSRHRCFSSSSPS
jgi:5-aminopentanamidase